MAQIFRRKKYVVQREMQFRFAKFVILFTCAASIFTGLAIFYTTFMMLGERLADVYPQGRLITIFRNAHMALVVNLIIIIPLIYFVSIRYSHRIAGPLPKIYEAIKNIGEGKYNFHLQLRKRDELQELADIINETARKLNDKQGPK